MEKHIAYLSDINRELRSKISNLEYDIKLNDFRDKAELLYFCKEKVILSFIAMYTESFELRDMALYLLYTITDEQLLQIDSDLNAETRNIIREIMSTYETGFGYQLLSLNNRIEFKYNSLTFVCENDYVEKLTDESIN